MTFSGQRVQTLVVGAGLGGVVAALAAAKRGDSVMVAAQGPAQSAQWSGVCDVFGDVLREPGTDQPITEASARLKTLLQRRRSHPYAALGVFTQADLKGLWDEAVGLLGGLVDGACAGGWCVTPLGLRRWADGACAAVSGGVWSGDQRPRLGFVGIDGFWGFDAPQAARTVQDQGGLARAVKLVLGAQWGEDASAAARGVEAMAWGDFLAAAKDAASGEPVDCWLFPAVLGRRLGEAKQRLEDLERVMGARVAELPGMDRSLHGWRLHEGLQALLEASQVERRQGVVEALRPVAQGIEVVFGKGFGVVLAERVVLATGRFFGGGLPRQGPWREPLTGAPLYLDGQAIVGGLGARLLGPRFLDDHPLMRAGLGVSRQGQVLDGNGAPVSERIFAVGSVLEGFSHGDGCAMGVALCTALQVNHALM